MRRLRFSLFTPSITAAALLAACGGSQLPIGTPGAVPQGSALAARPGSTYNYKVMYSFAGFPKDGADPRGSLIDVGGTLYGTTENGGTNHTCDYSKYFFNCGTVFSITTGGTEKVLYSFGAHPDGEEPVASLLDVHGRLYGTTEKGGTYSGCTTTFVSGCGTVFRISTGGTEKVLHSFGTGNDGIGPRAPLIKVKGLLYGTTAAGGASCNDPYTYRYTFGCGTVFSITTGGTERVLHSFGQSADAGKAPSAGLIDVNGKLYGTTYAGGRPGCLINTYGCGTVFSITTSGRVKVLHRFGNGHDGTHPAAALINVSGTLYGTTEQGGAYGEGTAFSITTGGKEKVLHSFGAGFDGAIPGVLIEANGMLYGTTEQGGSNTRCPPYYYVSCGTVFSMTTHGTEKVLHDFGHGTDGYQPDGLIDVGGTLYGTTQHGGTYNNGTVFALTP